jgi:hypothetical protein
VVRGLLIYTVRRASVGKTMGIGTPRYLPFGITTDDRWGAARRRRLVAICGLCALAVAGFVVAVKAHDLIITQSADAPAAGVSPGPEAPTEPAAAPVPVPSAPSPAVIEPPAPATEPSSVPTVLRGAGIKPR